MRRYIKLDVTFEDCGRVTGMEDLRYLWRSADKARLANGRLLEVIAGRDTQWGRNRKLSR